jgi:hypothetical protein
MARGDASSATRPRAGRSRRAAPDPFHTEPPPRLISIRRCRELLAGDDAAKASDAKIAAIRASLYGLANLVFEARDSGGKADGSR